jgi:hypothetical protein
MGRVRRYKKIKNVDPYSKQRKRDGNEGQRDDPPDIFEEKGTFVIVCSIVRLRRLFYCTDRPIVDDQYAVKRSKKRFERQFDDLEYAEKVLQREALRNLRDSREKVGICNCSHSSGPC